MVSDRMTIEEVSEIIGDSPHQIRVKARYDMYDPPICRVQKRKNGKYNRYLFFRSMVMEYVGRSVPELH